VSIMDNTILGLSPATFALVLAGLTGFILLEVAGTGAANGLLVRIGVRNMVRRPSQTLLLLCGLVLSATLITMSFGLQDSLTFSAQARHLAQVGNLDETVTGTFTQAQAERYLSQLRRNPNIQAATALVTGTQQTAIFSERTHLSKARLNMLAVPSNFDQVFGPITTSTGQSIHFSDLRSGEVLISATLAQSFDVQAGDVLQVMINGHRFTTKVRAILSNDLVMTINDATPGSGHEQVILPLSFFQQVTHSSGIVNTLAIKNIGRGGMDDVGPNDSRTQAVTNLLVQLFHVNPYNDSSGVYSGGAKFTQTEIHIIKPVVINYMTNEAFSDSLGFQGALQFDELLPAFTDLLVGAGMLLLALLFILLATERRAELGMSRAIGMQRSQLIQALLIEGAGYSVVATLMAIPLAIGAVALELAILSNIPLQTFDTHLILHMPLVVYVNWSSLVIAGCLSVLTSFVVVFLTAVWISRANIVAAIRDLDEPAMRIEALRNLLRAMWSVPSEAQGDMSLEMPARSLQRRLSAGALLLWGLFLRGPLCLLLGIALFLGGPVLQRTLPSLALGWLEQLGMALLIMGGGLLLIWVLTGLKVAQSVVSRIGYSLIGLGWLIYGSWPGSYFLSLFGPPGLSLDTTPRALEIVLPNLMVVAGAVALLMANVDVLIAGIGMLTSRVRGLAPVSRTSLSYPLTFRFRTTVTVSLLGLVIFLTILLVTTNVGSIQQAQAVASSAGFQLTLDFAGGKAPPLSLPQQIQANPVLRQEIAAVGITYPLKSSQPGQMPAANTLLIPGQAAQASLDTVQGVNDAFVEHTTLPLQARARGFTSDQQVWDAVKDHPGFAVWHFESNIKGISLTENGFQPFFLDVTDSAGQIHRLTIIGIVAPNPIWPIVFVSSRVFPTDQIEPYPFYYLLLQPGVRKQQAAKDLVTAFGAKYGMQVEDLADSINTATLANLTLFLSGYLALGLLFGALSIGIIMSRAVVERRQQIGMLRALGFSHALVERSFLVEGGFVITLSLLVGTVLALWTAYQVSRPLYHDFPIPVLTIILILLGSYLVAFLATSLSARQAARIRPAEALRYE
jgi:putative ABC transport system permease protein